MVIRGVAAAVVAAVLLTGCGEAADDAGDAGTPGASSSADAEVRQETTADPGDLADLAEELAADEPAPGSIAPRDQPVQGADISWPQCPKGMGIPERPTEGMPMPVAAAEFVVIGLTNGPAFTPNPCLADQVEWVAERGLMVSAYSVLSYPDERQLERYGSEGPHNADNRLGRLRNVGYQQAAYNLANMQRAGLRTPIVWLDVEPVSIWEWSNDLEANAAIVQGAARGYRDADMEIGVYSTAYMWRQIVGDFALGVPEWRAAGQTDRAEAERRCGAPDHAIQGGQAVLGQWVADRRDHNITCNGSERELDRWFHR